MSAVASDLFEQFKSRGYPRIRRAIDSVEPEGLHLDFKEWSSDWKRVLGKVASGFANVDGGVVVFGIKARGTGRSDDPRTAQEEAPIPNVQPCLRAVLDAASELLDPSLPGIECALIDHPNDDGSGFLVVRVPFSPRKPHQSIPHHGYFLRTGSNSVHMPDSIVRALATANAAPLVSLRGRLTSVQEDRSTSYTLEPTGFHSFFRIQLQIDIENTGQMLAEECAVAIENMEKVVHVIDRPTVTEVTKPSGERYEASFYRPKGTICYPGMLVHVGMLQFYTNHVTPELPHLLTKDLRLRYSLYARGVVEHGAVLLPAELQIYPCNRLGERI